MMGHAVICILLLPPTMGYLPSTSTALDRIFLPFFRRFKESMPDFSVNQQFLDKQRREQRAQATLAPSFTFFCENTGNGTLFRSKTPPTSVHSLRPGDFDIIAAMGDSLTAGNGATSPVFFTVGVENRGISWSGGATADWRSFTTLPNIIREFNPNLIGFSLPGSFNHKRSTNFNVAELGAISADMVLQARLLVKRLKKDPRVDIERHWKLITIMIGSNDFCVDMCYGGWQDLPERHRKDLHETFGILKKELPRTLINFVLQPDLEMLTNLKNMPPACHYLQLMLCPCLIGRQFERIRPQLVRIMDEYREVEIEVADDPRYKDKDDFAVVLQPFTKGMKIPTRKDDPETTDTTFFSPDCFHLSQKGYAFAALALWNNMMEPEGNKSETWTAPWERVLCPTEDNPFVKTQLNSVRK